MTAIDWQKRMGRLEELVQSAEALRDDAARGLARELVQVLLEVHGEGMRRLLDAARGAAGSGPALAATCSNDELLGSLLMLHGLHPLPLATRVDKALERVRPALRAHDGDVELVGLDGGVVRIRLTGTCKTCPSSTATLRSLVESALYEEAPDLAGCEVAP